MALSIELQLRSVASDHLGKPPGTVFVDAVSRGEIHVDQAEAFAVAAVPFEIVCQGPMEVAQKLRTPGEGVLEAP